MRTFARPAIREERSGALRVLLSFDTAMTNPTDAVSSYGRRVNVTRTAYHEQSALPFKVPTNPQHGSCGCESSKSTFARRV